MTLRRALIRVFDRPGGRAVLGSVITSMARRYAPGVRAYFDRGMWVHRERGVVFVDGASLDYHPSVFRGWANEEPRILVDAADHYMSVYKPRPGDVILDIGAGKGEDTLAFSRAVGPAGRVIAFEAHPGTFRCLRLFCEWNGLDNVVAMNFAIADRAGMAAIESAPDWQANRVLETGGGRTLPVSSLTLDEALGRENLARIDFLKMNIEGAEIQALRGMEQTLPLIRALCISCHDFRANKGHGENLRTKAIVQDAVQRAGFRIVPRDRDPRPYVADQVNAVRD